MASELMGNNEQHNLLRCFFKPVFFCRVIIFLFQRIFYSFQYRYFSSSWYYPKEVREALLGIRNYELGIKNLRIKTVEHSGGMMPGRLKLATGFLEYEGAPNWRQEFADPEQIMSLHRWGWLIFSEMEAERGVALMRSWLSVMGPVPDGVAGTSYTTSERIVNALLFCRQKKMAVPEDLRAALLTTAFHLAKHIEYHGVRGTGNHLVNNARALFFAGQIFEIKELSSLACAVVKDALPWLVTKDGFLREESSHYHLLFTRWILEMHRLAEETDHSEMTNQLKSYVCLLTERCQFFLVEAPSPPNPPSGRGGNSAREWRIPLIGDVSPDCTPEWLIEYLGGAGGGGAMTQVFPESGWFRLDRGALTIFWHVSQENMIHRATHGHADLCSLVIFREGELVLTDPGRLTYGDVEGCLARDHNALTIDGLGPSIYDRAQKFPVWYQPRATVVSWQEQPEEFVITFSHTGFHRLAGSPIDHLRRFRINADQVKIEDELGGRGAHAVEIYFHLAQGKDNVTIDSTAGAVSREEGWTAPAYGVKIPSIVSVVRSKVQLPCTLRHSVSWRS